MPTRVNISDTRIATLGGRRSLLAEIGMPVSLYPYDVSEHGADDPCAALFLSGLTRRGLPWVERKSVPFAGPRLSGAARLGDVELSFGAGASQDLVLTRPGGELVLLVGRKGTCEINVAAASATRALVAARELADELRDPPPPDEQSYVHFWANGERSPDGTRRALDTPVWDDIAGNYTAPVRTAMEELLAATEPGRGSLLLWHGPPGTGKSHALRALVQAWRPWCSAHYVTDPEHFLGGASYLMAVATSWQPEDAPPWRLIVLEDAGELMSVSARSETGQGLSRVLNLTDGLLGQGTRCILLVTTNEPVGRLHPAVRRPGRCWMSTEFGPLAPPEASAWLALHGVDREATRPTPLAELFALAEGREPEREGPAEAFGFARGLRG